MDGNNGNNSKYVWVALRIAMGWLFLWPFLDKLLGLGFATEPDAAWIRGGSPTFGFLSYGTSGPMATIYQSLAGNPMVDFAFMMGLLLIGLSLILGIGVRIAGFSGALFMTLLWMANLPPAQNPLIDQHVIYGLLLVGLALMRAGQWYGLGTRLSRTWARNAPLVAAVLQ
jgi:thiosulfate dehydrogenase [quinone] large subunit